MRIRVDYLKDETIMYSSSRMHRPNNYVLANTNMVSATIECPFCSKNEDMIRDIVYKNNRTGIRIVKNLYPAIDGVEGIHDVVIESYDHNKKFKDFDEVFVYDFLKTIKYRYDEISKMDDIKHIQIFKNNGRNSGASLEHSHWQIIGTNFVPSKIKTMNSKFEQYQREKGVCYNCSQKDLYKIMEDDEVFVGIPYASSASISFRIVPKKHYGDFSELDDKTLKSISNMLLRTLSILNALEENLSYNILFFSKPASYKNDVFHFFIEVVGRKGRYGGFELSAGGFISSILPEDLFEKIKSILEV